jgi:Uma2 family endonuclease
MAPIAANPATYGQDAAMMRFSVAKYQRMVETGILTAEDKVELLENYVVLKMPHNPPHDGTVQMVGEAVGQVLPRGWRVRMQSAVALADSQPEPDLAVVRGDKRTYLPRHPGPADVGLVIEVADSSLLRDQRDKVRIYARAGLAVYWLVNLVDQRLEVYAHPTGPAAVPAYQSFQTFQPGDTVPLVLDGATVTNLAAAELLP